MKPKLLINLILFSLLVTIGCNNDETNPNTETQIEFSEIGKGALYGNGAEGIEQSNLVIINQTDWQNLMDQMDSYNTTTNEFTETEIDFNNFEIIAIFLEIKGSGWEVEIDNLIENENSIIVSTVETEYIYTVISQPFHIIKIPKTEKNIIFEKYLATTMYIKNSRDSSKFKGLRPLQLSCILTGKSHAVGYHSYTNR